MLLLLRRKHVVSKSILSKGLAIDVYASIPLVVLHFNAGSSYHICQFKSFIHALICLCIFGASVAKLIRRGLRAHLTDVKNVFAHGCSRIVSCSHQSTNVSDTTRPIL